MTKVPSIRLKKHKCVQVRKLKIKFETFVVKQSPAYIGIPPRSLLNYHFICLSQLFDNLLQGKPFVVTLSQYSLLSFPSLHCPQQYLKKKIKDSFWIKAAPGADGQNMVKCRRSTIQGVQYIL